MPKITGLPSDTTITSDDLLPIVDLAGPTTKRITLATLSSVIKSLITPFSASLVPTIWWEELGRTTLTADSDIINVNITPKKYLRLLVSVKSVGLTDVTLRFNNDASANYGYQFQVVNGNTTTTGTSTAALFFGCHPVNLNDNDDAFGYYDITNSLGRQKLITGNLQLTGVFATNFDPALILFGHWTNTSNQITNIKITNTQTGDFATGSEIVVLGHD